MVTVLFINLYVVKSIFFIADQFVVYELWTALALEEASEYDVLAMWSLQYLYVLSDTFFGSVYLLLIG